MQNNLLGLLEYLPLVLRRNIWFMHYGDSYHLILGVCKSWIFGNQWLGKEGSVVSFARLTYLDFFPGLFENIVYSTPIDTWEILLDRTIFFPNN